MRPNVLLITAGLLLAAPDTPHAAGFASLTDRRPAFENSGTRAGFTGANQSDKVTETTDQDHDGNGRSLRCYMNRSEPDVPGGCHAEAHLSRLADGQPFGDHPGFTRVTSHWARFDPRCDEAAVGFWQLKNHGGPDRWRHLVALWRAVQPDHVLVTLQVNPAGSTGRPSGMARLRFLNFPGTRMRRSATLGGTARMELAGSRFLRFFNCRQLHHQLRPFGQQSCKV